MRLKENKGHYQKIKIMQNEWGELKQQLMQSKSQIGHFR